MTKLKIIKIEILQNQEKTGYEVYICGNRANAEQEAGILFATRKECEKMLPVSERTIWIG